MSYAHVAKFVCFIHITHMPQIRCTCAYTSLKRPFQHYKLCAFIMRSTSPFALGHIKHGIRSNAAYLRIQCFRALQVENTWKHQYTTTRIICSGRHQNKHDKSRISVNGWIHWARRLGRLRNCWRSSALVLMAPSPHHCHSAHAVRALCAPNLMQHLWTSPHPEDGRR